MRIDDPDVPPNYRQCTCKPCKHALPPVEVYAFKYCQPCRTRYRLYQAERAAKRKAGLPLNSAVDAEVLKTLPPARQKKSRKVRSDEEENRHAPKRSRKSTLLRVIAVLSFMHEPKFTIS